MGGFLEPTTWSGKFFDGGWRASSNGGGVGKVIEKATGEELGEVGIASADDVVAVAAGAAEAQRGWASASYEERAGVMRRAAEILHENEAEISDWIVREAGSIRPKAAHELHATYNEILQASAMPAQPYGQLLPTATTGRISMARRVPHGVVGVIAPWNFPLLLSMRSVAPALAVGNAVVLKPDPQTAVCAGAAIARVFEEAGLPEGVLGVLPGGAEAGEALVTDRNVAMVSFTGSTAVGRRVGELAGRNLKKVSLELGGNGAFIVLDDADMEVAASAGAWGSYLHQGQICMAASRHLVHERVADEYLERLSKRANNMPVGDPFREQVAIGPLINERQVDRVDGIVKETVAAGATVRAGGEHDGLLYRPTVLEDVTPNMRAFAEEIFGPVAPVSVFADDDEAVALANNTEYGLSAGIHTGSLSRGLAIANRLRSGLVHVNDQPVNDEAHAPFGGMGISGNGGHFGGQANWEEFTQWQWFTLREKAERTPF